MKWFAVIVALLLALSGARAEGPDDQYVRIYNLIQEADKLNSGGQPREALPKYLEAQTALQRFQKGFPDWNVKVISFRLNYVAAKIAAVSARIPAPVAPAPGSTVVKPAAPPSAGPQPVPPAPPSDWENQLAALKDQVARLQADKAILEAKLKEALAVQPAALDPRELARAEEKIRGLLKENDLLKVSLAQEQAKLLPAPDTKVLEETRQALAEANRKLAEQTKTANGLALEKTALQNKLDNLTPSPANAAALETTRKALEEAKRKLAEQSKLASELALEKEALQGRLKTLNAEAEAAAALRAENQLLQKQLADLKAAPPPTAKAEEANRQLAQAQAQIAALQSDKEMLRLEKLTLENRVKQLSASPVTPAALPAPTQTTDASRIKQLERERDDLQKQLAAANKELYSRKGNAAAARLADIENQLVTLRARLEVFEARQVPYTAEELALFKQPETQLAQADRKGSWKSVRELPPDTVALLAEAQRHYANKQFDQAEQNYLQVLQRDNKNVPTLANLAAIELDLDHFEAAEINIKQAVALAPEDPYSLFVLGRLRFRQRKYDEAIDAFSRAANLDPLDAQIQNFLGLALSEKGLRGPAETALRKAIQLDPGYANAHNNLAVVYITQQPPLVELARWHYQKARAAGHPRNPELEKMLDAQKAAASGQ
ncbi:MAG: tetratricopeptide repeat protein [Verrucomicrobiota bacterium]|jgi:tetratricopeptide (TPR) repeat protein